MRGRPKGRTDKGLRTRTELYRTAIRLFGERGYDQTTLRDIARAAGVSPGLLYKYFPGKSAVVMALYDDLSAELTDRTLEMEPGPWHDRAFFVLETSLAVLSPHRPTLAALTPILVGDPEQGLFAEGTAFSRARVQEAFIIAVRGSREKLAHRDAEALGRLLYVLHLAILLWWLLDRTPGQAATAALVRLARSLAPAAALAMRLARTRAIVRQLDALVRQGLFGERP